MSQPVSAQVILNTAASAQEVRETLKRAGFDVGPLSVSELPNFSITGLQTLFEQRFAVSLQTEDSGEIRIAGQEGEARHELPLDKLREELPAARNIRAVVFTPPDFGLGTDF